MNYTKAQIDNELSKRQSKNPSRQDIDEELHRRGISFSETGEKKDSQIKNKSWGDWGKMPPRILEALPSRAH